MEKSVPLHDNCKGRQFTLLIFIPLTVATLRALVYRSCVTIPSTSSSSSEPVSTVDFHSDAMVEVCEVDVVGCVDATQSDTAPDVLLGGLNKLCRDAVPFGGAGLDLGFCVPSSSSSPAAERPDRAVEKRAELIVSVPGIDWTSAR